MKLFEFDDCATRGKDSSHLTKYGEMALICNHKEHWNQKLYSPLDLLDASSAPRISLQTSHNLDMSAGLEMSIANSSCGIHVEPGERLDLS